MAPLKEIILKFYNLKVDNLEINYLNTRGHHHFGPTSVKLQAIGFDYEGMCCHFQIKIKIKIMTRGFGGSVPNVYNNITSASSGTILPVCQAMGCSNNLI